MVNVIDIIITVLCFFASFEKSLKKFSWKVRFSACSVYSNAPKKEATSSTSGASVTGLPVTKIEEVKAHVKSQCYVRKYVGNVLNVLWHYHHNAS